MSRSMAASSRGSNRIESLKLRIIDDAAPSDAELGHALRLLARLMVRGYEAHGDHTAISHVPPLSSALTVSPNPRPDHDANNEAA